MSRISADQLAPGASILVWELREASASVRIHAGALNQLTDECRSAGPGQNRTTLHAGLLLGHIGSGAPKAVVVENFLECDYDWYGAGAGDGGRLRSALSELTRKWNLKRRQTTNVVGCYFSDCRAQAGEGSASLQKLARCLPEMAQLGLLISRAESDAAAGMFLLRQDASGPAQNPFVTVSWNYVRPSPLPAQIGSEAARREALREESSLATREHHEPAEHGTPRDSWKPQEWKPQEWKEDALARREEDPARKEAAPVSKLAGAAVVAAVLAATATGSYVLLHSRRAKPSATIETGAGSQPLTAQLKSGALYIDWGRSEAGAVPERGAVQIQDGEYRKTLPIEDIHRPGEIVYSPRSDDVQITLQSEPRRNAVVGYLRVLNSTGEASPGRSIPEITQSVSLDSKPVQVPVNVSSEARRPAAGASAVLPPKLAAVLPEPVETRAAAANRASQPTPAPAPAPAPQAAAPVADANAGLRRAPEPAVSAPVPGSQGAASGTPVKEALTRPGAVPDRTGERSEVNRAEATPGPEPKRAEVKTAESKPVAAINPAPGLPGPARGVAGDQVVSAAVPIKRVKPFMRFNEKFDPEVVSIQVSVNALGVVTEAHELPPRAHNKVLAARALEAARLWTFRPAQRGTRDVASEFTLQFKFSN